MDLLIALDAGTTGVRAVAFDAAARVVDSAYRELTQFFPSPGEVEHDALEIARLSIDALREVAARARERGERVLAVGLTNQRETTVAFDRDDGHLTHRALVWQDRRTAAACVDLAAAGHGGAVRATTGLVLDPYFSATKMRWLLDHGALDDARAGALATVDTWLLWRLTGGADGGVFATEPSNAARTCLMDLAARDWSSEMLDLFGVPAAALAPIVASCSTFGSIDPSVVPELGGVPIAGVLGDQQAALFGQACVAPGVVKATYGTGAFVLANAGPSVPDVVEGLVTTVAWDLGERGGATYALEGSSFVAGAAVQWLRDELGFLAESSDLEALALQAPSSDGVMFVPAFTGLGSPFWRADARGAITGLSRGVGRAQIALALVEALAYQVRAMTDAFALARTAPVELRADGGAAAMDLLLQLQATNSRLPVLRSRSLEATARGAATLAGLGVDLYRSLEDVASLWEADRRFEPEDPLAADAGYAAWCRAAERA
ncbi:MAG: glycerol kinase GlpK [Acidobacteriota bacterium]|nr:glycerol kinase GlpK [Acidobacteriota bacterium]